MSSSDARPTPEIFVAFWLADESESWPLIGPSVWSKIREIARPETATSTNEKNIIHKKLFFLLDWQKLGSKK